MAEPEVAPIIAPFALGADPEGVLVVKKTGKIRSPQDIIYDPDPHDERGEAKGIGKDGNRETSSFELRPGRSDSAVVLVNRMAELIGKLHRHYHPRGIVYKAGAYWHPEPLGGHIHLSWPFIGELGDAGYPDKVWKVCEIIKGFRTEAEFLVPRLFSKDQMIERKAWATAQGRDFGSPMSMRPTGLDKVLRDSHVEYRYPPSWLDTPETAYCFLGGAEFIVRTVLDEPVGKNREWVSFVEQMFTDDAMAPPNSPSLAEALRVAERFKNQEDFAVNWVDQ